MDNFRCLPLKCLCHHKLYPPKLFIVQMVGAEVADIKSLKFAVDQRFKRPTVGKSGVFKKDFEKYLFCESELRQGNLQQ